jgi:hypothetical protein
LRFKLRARAPLLCAFVPAGLLLWPQSGSPAQPGQICDTSRYPLSTPTTRFEDHGDGTVTDKESKLMWMRCAIGQTWAGGTCVGSPTPLAWAAAQEAAQSVNKRGSFFYSDWRVPQVPELAGIAERQCQDPRINLTIFPHTPAEAFWTATSRPSNGTEAFAFTLSFGAEGVKYMSKEEKHDVRLVRTAP